MATKEDLFKLVRDNHLWMLAAMLERDIDINIRNEDGLSLLGLANKLGHEKMVSYLKSKGAIE